MTDKADTKEASIPSYRSTGYDYKIESYQYPTSGIGDHLVRFYINLDEESKLITGNKVEVLGNVDQTDQTRLRNKPIDQDDFVRGVTTVAAIGGAAAASSIDEKSPVGKTLRKIKGFRGNNWREKATLAITTGVIGGASAGLLAYAVSKEIKVDKKLKRLASTITLYIPTSVSNQQRTSWENYNDVVFEVLQQGMNSETLESIKNGGIASAARVVATAASDLVGSATRSAVNPKKDLLFRSIERREFMFDYQFAPKNKIEADAVANIIYMFRLFSAPEVVEGTAEYLYTYPAEFDIEYIYKGNGTEEQNKYLNKISSCVLKNVTVNYSPNGSFQTLERGEPVQVNLTLHFEEIETMHRDRIAKGY